ncbi:hypothetical protein MACK_001047 [Theileria orientalis]|uniref:Uncharacterized protein n=1 Tax=Theileria orientalis TaxID=68886 RepID=A0A976MCC9_THEOR|nr:hypothetical protein MACK_001047 [Theileria orientalis]
MGGGKTVPTNEYREPRYESSDPREIPPKKPPKRRPLTSNHEPYFRFNHIDPTERRHTTQRRHLSHPAEARDKQRQPGKNLIVLDIDKRHDVYGYQISYERNKVIFRANPSYLFRQVKKGNDIGWYSKNDGEYPYKVVYTCNRGEDEIKVFFPKPEGFDEHENVEVVRADRPVYDKSKDPKYMYAQGTPETSVPLPHEHTQPEVNIHQPDFTQIPMGSEYTQPQIQPVYNHVQMPDPFSQIPMTPEHTPSHMDPELTHIPMSPEQIHSKVPGGTRSFEPTEAHGSHTHGTDPRFNRRHTDPLHPKFQDTTPHTTPNTHPPRDTRTTHKPQHPPRTLSPTIHSKVPGGTRSFEPTEAHGSHTHGTDPRFNRRHTHRPDQNVEQEVQYKITDPIARLRERHRQIEETERLSDLSVIDSRPSGTSGLPTSPYPEPSIPPSTPMAQPDLSSASTHLLPTPASLTPSHPVQNPEPAPTPTPAGKLAPKSHEPTVAPAQVPESDSSSFQLSPKRLRKPVGESEGILYMTLQVPPQPGVVPCEPSPLHQVSPMKVPEGHIPEDVGPVSFSYPAPSDTSVFDSSYSHSKVMVDASTSTINYVDASTQFPERSVPVQVSSVATSEKSTSTHDLETFQHSLAESVARSRRSKDQTRRDVILIESTPADEPIREPPVPELPRRQEPITRVLPNDDEVAVEHIFEDAEVDYSRVLQVGADEEPEVPPSRPSKTRVQTIRHHTVREEPRQETVRQEVVSEHTTRDSPESDDIFAPPPPRDSPERVSGSRESSESEERVREQRSSESSASHAPRTQETRSDPSPKVSASREASEPIQSETTRESDARPSTSGERIRRTTTSAGDRINITQSENEIRINTADPENGTYSIGIDPKQHDKVVLTFANNSTVFVLDGASHTLGLNQGGEPRDIISDRLTMQRAQPQPVGGLIGGPTPVYTDVPPVTKFATPQQRDPETVPSDSSVPDSGPSDQGAPGADPSEQRRGKFTIPDEALGQLPPPPYSGFQAPSYLPESQVIPDQRSLDRLLRLLEVSTMANLAQMSRPAPYVPTTNVNVTHNPHDPSDTAGSNDSDSEEIGSGSPEPSTSSAVDPSSSPLAEGEPSTEDQAEAISIDQGGSSEDQSAIPRPRSDGDVSGRGSTPILIPLEDDDNESGTEFSLDINATDNDENITETKKDASTNESTYKFKSTTRCTEVRIDTVTIWKKGEQSINKPRDVKVNEAKDEVTICNGTKGVVYKLDNGTWRYDSTVTYTDGGSDQSKHGSEVQLDSATKKPVELNIKKKDSTDEFKYVKMDKTGTYTANEGYGFNRVVAKGPTCCSSTKNIWDARVKNEYGNKVVVDGIGDKKKTLTIHFDEDKILTFSKDTKEWLEQTAAQNEMDAVTATVEYASTGVGELKTGVVSGYSSINQAATNVESTGAGASPIPGSGTKTGVDLSLKATAATPQFDYNKAGQVVTFTAKDGFGFKSVKTGKNGDIVVWSTDNASEYATKVVLNGKGKKQKEVTIHLPNGTTKVFKRDGKGKPWTEVIQQGNQATGQPGSGTPGQGATATPPASSGGRQSSNNLSGGSSVAGELKLFKDDGNGNAVEMVDADYVKRNALGYDIYRFKDGVKCTLVKYNDEDVWKKGDENVEEPTYVNYDPDTHNVVVSDGKKSAYYKKDDNGKLVRSRATDDNHCPLNESDKSSGSPTFDGTDLTSGGAR